MIKLQCTLVTSVVFVKRKLRPAEGLGSACAPGKCVCRRLHWETFKQTGVCGWYGWWLCCQAMHNYPVGGYTSWRFSPVVYLSAILSEMWPHIFSTNHVDTLLLCLLYTAVFTGCVDGQSWCKVGGTHTETINVAHTLPNVLYSSKRKQYLRLTRHLLSVSNQWYIRGYCVYLVSKHNVVFFRCVLKWYVYTNYFNIIH